MAFTRLVAPRPRALLTTWLSLVLYAQPPLAWGVDSTEPSPSELPPTESPSDVAYSGSVSAVYGVLPDASDSLNPFGVGVGIRLGMTLPMRLHFGLSYDHFFGGEPSRFANIAAYESEGTVDQVQGWVGYQLPL